MFRGINRQQIFEEAEDNYKFLSILYDFKAICEYELFAYCLGRQGDGSLVSEKRFFSFITAVTKYFIQ